MLIFRPAIAGSISAPKSSKYCKNAVNTASCRYDAADYRYDTANCRYDTAPKLYDTANCRYDTGCYVDESLGRALAALLSRLKTAER